MLVLQAQQVLSVQQEQWVKTLGQDAN